MLKKKGKFISLLLMCVLAVMFCTACVQEGEPPKMRVSSGKTEMKNLITKEIWEGEERKAVNPFQVYAKKNKELVKLKTGDKVVMEFVDLSGEAPEKVELQVYTVNEDGTFKEPDADPQILEVEWKDKKAEFEVPEYSLKGKAYGYDLRCTWGEDICRYNFMVK